MYESPPWTSSRKIILPPPSLHFFQWLDKHGYGCCFWILKIGEKKCISTLRNCKCDTSEYGMKFWINFINTAIVSLATWLECLNSIRLNKPLDRNSFVFFFNIFSSPSLFSHQSTLLALTTTHEWEKFNTNLLYLRSPLHFSPPSIFFFFFFSSYLLRIPWENAHFHRLWNLLLFYYNNCSCIEIW